jgi:hypothetical protein
MFSKISRYRKLPDIITVDAKGRTLASKPARLLPKVTGKFLHVIEEKDRVDHLAFKYYRQPCKWWRICDANSDFISPQALLGKEPIVTDHFPLIYDDSNSQPPWADLIKQLSLVVGVENFQIIDDLQILPDKQVTSDKEAVYVKNFQRAVVVTYNQMNVNTTTLADKIKAVGFKITEQQTIGRTGKSIIIPPDTIG